MSHITTRLSDKLRQEGRVWLSISTNLYIVPTIGSLRPGLIYQRDSTVGSGRYQSVYGTGGYNTSRGQLYD